MPAPAHYEWPQNGGGESRGKRAEEDRQRGAWGEVFERHAGTVGADAEVGSLAEREAPGKAKQDVQAHGSEPIDQDLGTERGVTSDIAQPPGHGD